MLSLVERERYLRQLSLLGEKGQEELGATTVLVAGVGGLGTVIAQMCAYAGFGSIRIVDYDVVERHNLNRQVLYHANDHGLFKVDVAARRLREINPQISVEAERQRISEETIASLVRGIDIIMDGMDNYPARYLLDDAAFREDIPFIHGAVNGFYGQVTSIIPGKSPCMHCIVPHPPPTENVPILGVTVGVIGCIQVTEAVKIVTGTGSLLTGRLLLWDGREADTEVLRVTCDPTCKRCNGKGA